MSKKAIIAMLLVASLFAAGCVSNTNTQDINPTNPATNITAEATPNTIQTARTATSSTDVLKSEWTAEELDKTIYEVYHVNENVQPQDRPTEIFKMQNSYPSVYDDGTIVIKTSGFQKNMIGTPHFFALNRAGREITIEVTFTDLSPAATKGFYTLGAKEITRRIKTKSDTYTQMVLPNGDLKKFKITVKYT